MMSLTYPQPEAPMKALLILAVAFALAGPSTAAAAPEKTAHKNVNADEFEKLSKEPDTVILDVRSPKEYAAGHIKNSVLIDFNAKDFDEKIKQLDKSKTYLVHCAVGGRSAKACSKMDGFDFPKVVNLEGGIKAWEKAGKPVEK
jgi:rhodanese-related sulfurtransferase